MTPYTRDDWFKDKVLLAKALHRREFNHAKSLVEAISVGGRNVPESISLEANGMLFVLDILTERGKQKS